MIQKPLTIKYLERKNRMLKFFMLDGKDEDTFVWDWLYFKSVKVRVKIPKAKKAKRVWGGDVGKRKKGWVGLREFKNFHSWFLLEYASISGLATGNLLDWQGLGTGNLQSKHQQHQSRKPRRKFLISQRAHNWLQICDNMISKVFTTKKKAYSSNLWLCVALD